MPELPDVEVQRRYFNRTALHKKVDTTRVFDDKVVKDVTAATLQRRVKNRTFETTERRGKNLFVQLDSDDGWLGIHFGMTGYLKYYKQESDTPEYTRMRFTMANGYHLAYVCRRNLGALRVVNDLAAFIDEKKLGPDALSADFETFRERIGSRRGGIKSALMNQSALAGLGNVYTDEILLHAEVHPESDMSTLGESATRKLFDQMRYVMEAAIDAGADPSEMPSDFLLPHRSGGADCPACGGTIRKITVVGRPTYYCPRCQKKR